MSDFNKYHLFYDCFPEEEGLTKEEGKERYGERVGGCDCILIHSVIGEPLNGEGLSHAILSMNGRTGEPLSAQQRFFLWASWAVMLVDELPAGGAREAVRFVSEVIREAFKNRDGEEDGSWPPDKKN